jgi:hypothetical protein
MVDDHSEDNALGKSFISSIPPGDPEEVKRTLERRIGSQHYAAIGRVAANWAFLESAVDIWSMKLAGVHARAGLCFTSQIAGIKRKLDAFIALSRLRNLPGDTVDKLCKFADQAQGQSERRNRIVHDVWIFEHPSTPARHAITAQRKLLVQEIPMSTEEVLVFADSIFNLVDRLDDLANIVLSSPKLSPEQPPQGKED